MELVPMPPKPSAASAAATARSETTRELWEEVMNNPYRLVNAEQIASIIHKSLNFVLAAKKSGAPFPGGVTRPEWVLEWLKSHPEFAVDYGRGRKKGLHVVN